MRKTPQTPQEYGYKSPEELQLGFDIARRLWNAAAGDTEAERAVLNIIDQCNPQNARKFLEEAFKNPELTETEITKLKQEIAAERESTRRATRQQIIDTATEGYDQAVKNPPLDGVPDGYGHKRHGKRGPGGWHSPTKVMLPEDYNH